MSTTVNAAPYEHGFMLVTIDSSECAFLVKQLTHTYWGLFKVSWGEFMLMQGTDELPLLETLKCITIGVKRECLSSASRIATRLSIENLL
jgi:hypothetical protein